MNKPSLKQQLEFELGLTCQALVPRFPTFEPCGKRATHLAQFSTTQQPMCEQHAAAARQTQSDFGIRTEWLISRMVTVT